MRRMTRVLGTAAALALACGGGGGGNSTATPTPTQEPPPTGGNGGGGTTPPPVACGGKVQIRLRGSNPTGIDRFVLQARLTEVQNGGALLTIDDRMTAADQDLLAGQSYRLGVVAVARNAGPCQATVVISAADALAKYAPSDAQDAPVAFDGCASPIQFSFDPALVNPAACHVVVNLDLRGSAATGFSPAGAYAPSFLPRFKIEY